MDHVGERQQEQNVCALLSAETSAVTDRDHNKNAAHQNSHLQLFATLYVHTCEVRLDSFFVYKPIIMIPGTGPLLLNALLVLLDDNCSCWC